MSSGEATRSVCVPYDSTGPTMFLTHSLVKHASHLAAVLAHWDRDPSCPSAVSPPPPSLRRFVAVSLCLAAALLSHLPSPLQADIGYSRPDPEARGGIEGSVITDRPLQAVLAFEAYELKVYRGAVDPLRGTYRFRGLPPGEYDLVIKTVGQVHEGITLEAPLGEPLDRRALDEACDHVADTFFTTEPYFNRKQIVRLAADGSAARMFVIQTRTKQVVDPAGLPIDAHIRRFDVVDLVKTNQVWQITTSRHLMRQEVVRSSGDLKVRHLYSPALGGVLVGDQVKDLGPIDLKKLPKPPKDQYFGSARQDR